MNISNLINLFLDFILGKEEEQKEDNAESKEKNLIFNTYYQIRFEEQKKYYSLCKKFLHENEKTNENSKHKVKNKSTSF